MKKIMIFLLICAMLLTCSLVTAFASPAPIEESALLYMATNRPIDEGYKLLTASVIESDGEFTCVETVYNKSVNVNLLSHDPLPTTRRWKNLRVELFQEERLYVTRVRREMLPGTTSIFPLVQISTMEANTKMVGRITVKESGYLHLSEKTLKPEEAFYVDPTFTNIIDSNGIHFSTVPSAN